MAKSGILVKSHDLKESFDSTAGQITIGIDLGDRNRRVMGANLRCVRAHARAILRTALPLPPNVSYRRDKATMKDCFCSKYF